MKTEWGFFSATSWHSMTDYINSCGNPKWYSDKRDDY